MSQRTDQLTAALAEIEREKNVRERCYSRWIAEGRLSKHEAQGRMAGILAALQLLEELAAKEGVVPSTGDTTAEPF